MRVLKALDQVLEPRTFLVGESITLADMAVATAVLLPFKYVCMSSISLYLWLTEVTEMIVAASASQHILHYNSVSRILVTIFFFFKTLEPPDRKVLNNVTRWFTTCINQPQFLKILGKISLCEKMMPVTPKMNTVANGSPAVNSADAPANGQEAPWHSLGIFL